MGTLVAEFVILYFSGAKTLKVLFLSTWQIKLSIWRTTQNLSSPLCLPLSLVQRPLRAEFASPPPPPCSIDFLLIFPSAERSPGCCVSMNYAGWDTTEQRNTSAIIIEKTILVGSIIRLQVGESDPFLLLLSSLSFLCRERDAHSNDSICCPDSTVSWVTVLFFILWVNSHYTLLQASFSYLFVCVTISKYDRSKPPLHCF